MSVVPVTSENYHQEVLQESKPVLIDFYATWCAPCRTLAPILESFAQDYQGQFKICKVDIDADSSLSDEFGIMSVPTLVVMKHGQVTARSSGVKQKAEILHMLEA